MFRTLVLLCFAALFPLSTPFAQDSPEKINATPEILALFNESLQSLAQADSSSAGLNYKAGTLFQLLGFAIELDNNEPAKKVIATLLELAPAIEPEERRNQLFEGVAHGLFDLDAYTEATQVLQRIADPASQYRSLLDLAVRFVFEHEEDETLPAFDIAGLLAQVKNAAGQAQDHNITAIANVLLGRVLAQQGKYDEAAVAFDEAVSIAQSSISDANEKETIFILTIQSQVRYGQLEHAQKTVQAVAEPEFRREMANAFIRSLINYEKFDDAERLIKALPAADDDRDTLIQSLVISSIETISGEKVLELSALFSDLNRESFLQAVAAHLQKIKREDIAAQVSQRLTDTTGAGIALLIGKIESFLEEQKFAEAIQYVDASSENEAFRLHLKRQILAMQYKTTKDDAVLGQMEVTFTTEDKIIITELREEADKAANDSAENDLEAADRIGILVALFREQLIMMDIVGARQTLKLMSGQLDKITDPVQSVFDRLLLAQLQIELQDKEGVRQNLGKLLQMLSATSDLNALRGLVQGEQAIDESVIREHLFQVYAIVAGLLKQADAVAESQSAFAKAQELARSTSSALTKAEQLLTLAKLLAEGEE